jgi:hypothetical protein
MSSLALPDYAFPREAGSLSASTSNFSILGAAASSSDYALAAWGALGVNGLATPGRQPQVNHERGQTCWPETRRSDRPRGCHQ